MIASRMAAKGSRPGSLNEFKADFRENSDNQINESQISMVAL